MTDDALSALHQAGVQVVTGVPDSLFAPLHKALASDPTIDYIPTEDEATAVGIAAGCRLAGRRSLVIMENSGLRRACETLSRLLLSQRLHVLLLISRRGEFGEPNWWGLAHEHTMRPHLEMLRIASHEVDHIRDLRDALTAGYATLNTGQQSAAVIATRSFTAELRDAQ